WADFTQAGRYVIYIADQEIDERTDVFATYINYPPVMSIDIPNVLLIDEEIEIPLNGVDPDGDEKFFSYRLWNRPDWLYLRKDLEGNSMLVGTPTADDVGAANFQVELVDGRGGSDVRAFALRIVSEPLPPTIVTSPPTQPASNSTYFYTLVVESLDSFQLTFTPIVMPSWLTLINNGDGTATLSGDTSDVAAGSYPVEIEVRDLFGLAIKQAFEIVVPSDEPVDPGDPGSGENQPPTIQMPSSPSVFVDQPVTILVTASDPDVEETLVFKVLTMPDFLSFVDNGDGTGRFSGIPTSAGSYLIEIEVEDSSGNRDRVEFILEVNVSSDEPFIYLPFVINE
ncbi:MAG: Ig domain-containing protein, partial [Chloroflexota bacterium]